MVFIHDEGSEFRAPLDKVWKLNTTKGEHSHPSLRNSRSEMEGEHPILRYETQMPDGSWAKHKVRLTLLPPVGIAFETLEGPMAGSKSFQYYTPKGAKTGITVVGVSGPAGSAGSVASAGGSSNVLACRNGPLLAGAGATLATLIRSSWRVSGPKPAALTIGLVALPG